MRTLIALLLTAAPAIAGQCPDGRWMDRMEYCDRPTPVLCQDGHYRDNFLQCPEARRPEPRPYLRCTPDGCFSSIVEVEPEVTE